MLSSSSLGCDFVTSLLLPRKRNLFQRNGKKILKMVACVCRLQVRIHPSIHVTSKFARRYGKYYESEVHVNLNLRTIISIIIAQGSDSSLKLFCGIYENMLDLDISEKVPGGFEPGTP